MQCEKKNVVSIIEYDSRIIYLHDISRWGEDILRQYTMCYFNIVCSLNISWTCILNWFRNFDIIKYKFDS
jgi:hypothetical protein